MQECWNQYPAIKPTKKDRYLVTLDDGHGNQHVTICTWNVGMFWGGGYLDHLVTAWQPLPEAFVDQEKNDPNYYHQDEITRRKYDAGDLETIRKLSIFDPSP